MRILLHRLVSALGVDVVAIRMDAVYTTFDEFEARKRKAGFRFAGNKPHKQSDMRNLTFHHKPRLPEWILEVECVGEVCLKPALPALTYQEQLFTNGIIMKLP